MSSTILTGIVAAYVCRASEAEFSRGPVNSEFRCSLFLLSSKDMTVRVEGARTMMAFLKSKGFDIPYNEIKDGTHDLAIWQALPKIFDFFERYKN